MDVVETKVVSIGTDLYQVSSFVACMPHLVFEVFFEHNEARVVSREGCTGTSWDRHAIQAVQAALICDTVSKHSAQ